MLTAAAPGLESIDVYTATVSNFGESLLLAVPKAFGGRKQTADVISMSLGECEAEQSESHAFDRALDHAFAIAGGAGISVLVASQDTGSTTCRTGPSGPGALPVLSPSFPATSGYVTAVGGTNVELDPENRISNQITWNDKPNVLGASGGGTSGLFGRPWYQRGVSGTGGSRKGKGRAVPDIAALADVTPGYAVYCSRPSCPAVGYYPVGGTSAATPLLAGGVALANQAAAEAGQANLGFLNPLLYEIGTGDSPGQLFYDVTEGNNDLGTLIPAAAGGGEPMGCCASRAGYDRTTGLGAPDVSALSRVGLAAGG